MSVQNEEATTEPVEAAAAAGAPDAATETTTILGGAKADGAPADDADAATAADADSDGDAGKADADPVDKAGTDADLATPYEGLTPPEGTVIDADTVSAMTPVLRGLGVETTEGANRVLEQAAPIVQSIVERQLESFVAQQETMAAEQQKAWADAARADPEVGGANYDKSVANAALAMDRLFAPDFRDHLVASGFANHPEMLRGLAKAGVQLREDTIHPPSTTINAKPGENLYDPAYSPKS